MDGSVRQFHFVCTRGLRFAKATTAEQGEAIFPEAQFYCRIRSFCSGNEED